MDRPVHAGSVQCHFRLEQPRFLNDLLTTELFAAMHCTQTQLGLVISSGLLETEVVLEQFASRTSGLSSEVNNASPSAFDGGFAARIAQASKVSLYRLIPVRQ
ncbi:unnamed protein product [Protopolystoma xenopodis]|uniref:Uncharacterized protein n=1 Tax=Protopolystoma xenopodis TaxID=117903 RepID=A0A3S5B827_9PLAT|nr:unnamed protein product [Protopolystoma xenopodis]